MFTGGLKNMSAAGRRRVVTSTARALIPFPLRKKVPDILRRPLLAYIFCRVAQSKPSQHLVNDWSLRELVIQHPPSSLRRLHIDDACTAGSLWAQLYVPLAFAGGIEHRSAAHRRAAITSSVRALIPFHYTKGARYFIVTVTCF